MDHVGLAAGGSSLCLPQTSSGQQTPGFAAALITRRAEDLQTPPLSTKLTLQARPERFSPGDWAPGG